jgi:recombination protein RecT
MAVNNSLIQQEAKKPAFSQVINSVPYQKMITSTLRDKKTADRFVGAIVSAVATSPALQECTPHTIVSAALLGETLNLSPSPQLGHYYLVPFKDKKAGVTNAAFVLGVKGYKQLAIRSGWYKRINAMEIKQGELKSYNPFDDEIELEYIEDEELRNSLPTIGYYAMFELHNGFKKVIYWSKEKMINHADKFSAAFSKGATRGKFPKVSYADFCEGKYDQKDAWLYSSFWYQNFDEMGIKTMLRQLLSKWGILSIEMQRAFEADSSITEVSGEVTFADGEKEEPTIQSEVVEAVPNEQPAPPAPEEAPTEGNMTFEDILGA